MLAIRRLQHHPGPARWLMERIGSCNPGAVASISEAGLDHQIVGIEAELLIHEAWLPRRDAVDKPHQILH